jgi:alpha-L-fucosidase
VAKRRKKTTQAERQRRRRMRWWHEARFGMFVHWGLYSLLGRHEWAMNRERIPVREYEELADRFRPKPRPMREWARLAKAAGQQYMVMTTKHHEGYCLWDTAQTDYNAVQTGPGRDLVQEYVDACREYDLKIGFYYSLMDWHHPDGHRCLKDEKARRRFLDFTQGCVRELMSNYGPVDILWYDVSWPLPTAEAWESRKMNRMVRRLQPEILINNRSKLPEDFGTPEEHIRAEGGDRAWEACMTFNGSWGYMPYAPETDWHSARGVLGMLQEVTAGGGNLLLNIGPKPDGSVPDEAVPRLKTVGKWLRKYGEAVYGEVDPVENLDWMPTGRYTRKGNTLYFWCGRWPAGDVTLGGFRSKLKKASLLHNGKRVAFEQTKDRIVFQDLPTRCPDRIAEMAVLKLDFASKPRQQLGPGLTVMT